MDIVTRFNSEYTYLGVRWTFDIFTLTPAGYKDNKDVSTINIMNDVL